MYLGRGNEEQLGREEQEGMGGSMEVREEEEENVKEERGGQEVGGEG